MTVDKEIKDPRPKAKMPMYEIVKQMVAKEKPMDAIKFNKTINEVANKMLDHTYWMLLCRERNDYTVFYTPTKYGKVITKELIPTLRNRGQVLIIEEQPDGAFEIWIRDPKTKENFAYYLFNYEQGVVECV